MNAVVQPSQKMDVIHAIDQAIQHTKQVLFRPFDAGTWLRFGLIIFLEVLAGGGSGISAGIRSAFQGAFRGFDAGSGTVKGISGQIDQGVHWIELHLALLVPVGLAVMCLMIALGVLLKWLSSHGRMMLIRAVACNDSRIGENWTQTREPAFSMFLFRLVLYIIAFPLTIVTMGLAAWNVVVLARAETDSVFVYVMTLLPYILIMVLICVAYGLINSLLRNFVAPLMFQFSLSCVQGWRQFGAAARGNVLRLILFYVLATVYWMFAGVVSMLVGCLTCCIAFIPVISQAILSPLHVFYRSYSMYVLESLGPEFRMIRGPEPPPHPSAELDGAYGTNGTE
jgi:hypothetical protein